MIKIDITNKRKLFSNIYNPYIKELIPKLETAINNSSVEKHITILKIIKKVIKKKDINLFCLNVDEISDLNNKLFKVYNKTDLNAGKNSYLKDKGLLTSLNEIFNQYNTFRDKDGIELAKLLNVKSCPYCNTIHTCISFKGKRILGKKDKFFQFDHFFPKSKYPYLNICMFNLIPTCSNCNQLKRDKEKNYFYHPFDISKSSFNEDCYFSFSTNELYNRVYLRDKNVKVELKSNANCDKDSKAYYFFFQIDDIIEFNISVFNDLVDKTVTYAAIFEGNKKDRIFKELFENDKNLFRFISGVYADVESILERPFGKALRDLSLELFNHWDIIYDSADLITKLNK